MRGALSVAELLLRAGADVTARDGRGYTVVHVAAQYGQTALLYLLALRWAAHVDACALLVFLRETQVEAVIADAC